MKRSQKNPKGAYDIGPPVILPEGHKGDVRDLVGKSAAVSGKTVDMFNYIEAKTPKLADALCEGSYDECGNKITIGGVYKDLIPPLADHEKAGLEEDIKHYGCYCPIITWNGYIIDGHHRYEICTWYKLSFRVEEKHFDSQNDAEIWIIENQFNRRNLPSFTRATLTFALEERYETRRGGNQYTKESGSPTHVGEADRNRDDEANRKAAKSAGMSHNTYAKCKFIDKHGTEEQKQELHNKLESIESKEAKALEGVYDVVVIDPPWEVDQFFGASTEANYTPLQYPTMPLEEIKELKLPCA